MEIVQELTLKAPRQKVWDFIWNVQEFAACVPGVKRVEQQDARSFLVDVEQRVAFLKASFRLAVRIAEQDPPHFIRTEGEGKDSKLAASLKQTNEVRLEALGEEETKVSIRSQVEVFGKLGTLGHSVIRNKANQMWREFAEALRKKIEG